MQVQVREAENTDLADLELLCKVVWISTYATAGIEPSFRPYLEKTFSKQALLNTMKATRIFLAEAGHLLVGAVNFNPKTAEISNLYVLPTMKRSGIGSRLIDACSEIAETAPWLTCWYRNEAAIRFYRAYGFHYTGETYFELDGRRHLNYVFTLGNKAEHLG